MDGKLIFWTFAFALMSAMVATGLNGWRQIRRGETRRHRRSMQLAIALFFSFVVAYLLKLRFLGREVFDQWSAIDIHILRVHETFVLILFLAGFTARWQARRLETSTANRRSVAQRHRVAGRIALISAILALLTAGVVLVGMFRRSSELARVSHLSRPAVAVAVGPR